MVKCYVWSVLLYGVEAWTLKVSTMNRLEAFEMWIHRRILRIAWTDKVSNSEVLRRAKTERELLRCIKVRKLSYLGHVMRGERFNLLRLIIEGKIEGRRGVGRRQMSWLRNIRDWTGTNKVADLLEMTRDRDAFGRMIANVGGT